MKLKEKAKYAPELLAQILSPYSSKNDVENIFSKLLHDEELLDLTIELSNRYFITPVFYSQLCAHQLENKLDKELHSFLIQMTNFMKERSLSLVKLVEEIVDISNKEKITPLLIKGSSSLFSDVYTEKGIRFMSDLDILFKEKDALKIFNILRKSSFSVPKQYLADIKPSYLEYDASIENLPDTQHFLPLYRKNAPCAVEIHYRPLQQYLDSYLNNDQAFSSSLDVTHPSNKNFFALKMSPENEIIYCFAHSERAHRFYEYHIFDIRQMDYFVRLVYTYQDIINWDEIHKRIENTGESVIFQHYLHNINQLFSLDFPVNNPLIEEKILSKYYKKGLESCFPRYHKLWLINRFVAIIKYVFSERVLLYRYNIDSNIDLFYARFYYTCRLIRKFSNPIKLYRRLKYF